LSVRCKTLIASACMILAADAAFGQATESPITSARPHNVVLFVPDGLRALQVTPERAPAMATIRDRGVNFKNPHSLFPTFTTANASAMATGHYLGDTGDFSNTIYTGKAVPIPDHSPTVTPFLENDRVLTAVDEMFGGDYLDEETLLASARAAGYATAAIGKLGPIRIFDHVTGATDQTIIVDDSTNIKDGTGGELGVPLPQEVKAAIEAIGPSAPDRGANGDPGDFNTPGTLVANVEQQKYFADVASKVVLPLFKTRDRPFVMVFWSRDPDGTQHNQGDSPQSLTPGINGPTSLAAVRNADDNLAQLQQALADLGLADTTDIVIAADHGFSTISKQSATSFAARQSYDKVVPGLLPPSFLAIDLAEALGLPLYDPDRIGDDGKSARFDASTLQTNGLIGENPDKPDVVIAANGGSDLIYLPNQDSKLAARVVDALLEQDYVSGIFVDDDLGRFAGTLPLSRINFRGKARPPHPAIAVSFRSFSTGCEEPLLCTVEVADTVLQQGQGMHGSFSRADTMNFMAAKGPDFKSEFADEAPVSNADIGKTLAEILGLKPRQNGPVVGRVITEAMPNRPMVDATRHLERSEPGLNGLRTVLNYQRVGQTRYFDVAGFPGRTVGLRDSTSAQR
jgi:arylsulfatase A-like enzyme